MPQRIFYNIVSDDLPAAQAFYQGMFDFGVAFESDWFVHLEAGSEAISLGILKAGHPLTEGTARGALKGGMLTIVVDDVDALHARASAAGHRIIEPPTNQFYGQRRMLIEDPHGLILDISSQCPPDPAWMQRVAARPGGGYVER